MTIASFSGEYRWLSNFWPVTIKFECVTYPSVEHAYQAAKSLTPGYKRSVAAAPSPNAAKALGRAVEHRVDWYDIKLSIMERLLFLKFADHNLRHKLVLTNGQMLIEGNTWGDTYWGICRGQGANHLGKLLMKVREDIIRGGR